MKLEAGQYDAIILAAAGIDRLNLSSCIRERLSEAFFTPAIAQGVIAIECREEDLFCREILQFLHDEATFLCVTAERAVNQVVGGDCYTPIGAHAKMMGDTLQLQAVLEKNNQLIRASVSGNKQEAALLGQAAGKTLCSS